MLAECALDVWKRTKSRLRRRKTRLPFFSKSRIHRIHRIYRIYRIATRGKPAIGDGGLAAIEPIGDSTVWFRSYYLPEVCPYSGKNLLDSYACFGVLCLPLTSLCKIKSAKLMLKSLSLADDLIEDDGGEAERFEEFFELDFS